MGILFLESKLYKITYKSVANDKRSLVHFSFCMFITGLERTNNMCTVEWCNNKQNIMNTGLCRNHYNQLKKFGCILAKRPRGKRNKYIIYDNHAELLILNEQGNIIVKSLIDKEDVKKLKRYSFRYESNKYIKGSYNGKTLYLHQAIMGIHKGLEIDHINRNKLDNRKSNLRIVDRITNANNITRKETYCITKVKRNLSKPYYLRIKNKYVGYYKTLEEAIKTRDVLLNVQ